MATLQLDDFTVLGRTFPEESRKYGQRICMAGYSPSMNSFMRVYPLMVPVGDNINKNGFQARHSYDMSLKRNPNDSRLESWRLADDNRPSETPWDKATELRKSDVVKWLNTKLVGSTHDLDLCKLSLGVILLEAGKWDGLLQPRDQYGNDADDAPGLFDQLDEDEELRAKSVVVRHAAYFKYADGRNGKPRKLQIREWGAYLGLAQAFADKPEKLWSAPGYNQERSLLVVVGNMCHHRNVWLAIKTFQLDPPPSGPSLLDGCETGDGVDAM
jgi:hypothetical protein